MKKWVSYVVGVVVLWVGVYSLVFSVFRILDNRLYERTAYLPYAFLPALLIVLVPMWFPMKRQAGER